MLFQSVEFDFGDHCIPRQRLLDSASEKLQARTWGIHSSALAFCALPTAVCCLLHMAYQDTTSIEERRRAARQLEMYRKSENLPKRLFPPASANQLRLACDFTSMLSVAKIRLQFCGFSRPAAAGHARRSLVFNFNMFAC